MKFIVVENDINTRKEIREVILKTTFDKAEVIIQQFSGACKELNEIIKDNSEPKIYILDIELDSKVSGIDIAKKIRDNDWESHIIFLTNHDKMFEIVYRNIFEIFDFIEKFLDMKKRLSKDIKKLLSKKYDNKFFCYHSRNIDLHLSFKNITYIERDTEDRTLLIHTDNNIFIVRKSLNWLIKQLDSRFKYCHRACIINTERVVEYNWSKCFFILDTKEKVELLSRKFKKEVIKDD